MVRGTTLSTLGLVLWSVRERGKILRLGCSGEMRSIDRLDIFFETGPTCLACRDAVPVTSLLDLRPLGLHDS